MRCLLAGSISLILVGVAPESRGGEVAPPARCYELRTYYAAPGRLSQLHARFRDCGVRLMEKYGVRVLGFWVPEDNPDGRLVYLTAHPSREARDQAWRALMRDPVWDEATRQGDRPGKLILRVENVFLEMTDYSPEWRGESSLAPRLFELRSFTTFRGRRDALNAQFRDVAPRLLVRHGIEQLAYWVPMKDQGGADERLVYLMAHKSREGAETALRAFQGDPEWQAARQRAEERAGGSLTLSNGAQTVFLVPTDYSPLK